MISMEIHLLHTSKWLLFNFVTYLAVNLTSSRSMTLWKKIQVIDHHWYKLHVTTVTENSQMTIYRAVNWAGAQNSFWTITTFWHNVLAVTSGVHMVRVQFGWNDYKSLSLVQFCRRCEFSFGLGSVWFPSGVLLVCEYCVLLLLPILLHYYYYF